jgi:hypothetical protein
MAREYQPAAFATVFVVEFVRIMQREQAVSEGPRQEDGHDGEQEMDELAITGFGHSEQRHDGAEAASAAMAVRARTAS